jgi:hypothetical protein
MHQSQNTERTKSKILPSQQTAKTTKTEKSKRGQYLKKIEWPKKVWELKNYKRLRRATKWFEDRKLIFEVGINLFEKIRETQKKFEVEEEARKRAEFYRDFDDDIEEIDDDGDLDLDELDKMIGLEP